jgi:hypothetical protein
VCDNCRKKYDESGPKERAKVREEAVGIMATIITMAITGSKDLDTAASCTIIPVFGDDETRKIFIEGFEKALTSAKLGVRMIDSMVKKAESAAGAEMDEILRSALDSENKKEATRDN